MRAACVCMSFYCLQNEIFVFGAISFDVRTYIYIYSAGKGTIR